jgi:hypothetical protein
MLLATKKNHDNWSAPDNAFEKLSALQDTWKESL